MAQIKVSPIQVAKVAARLWPAIKLVAEAVNRNSDGGKKVTVSELDEIISTLLGQVLDLVGEPADG